MGQRTAKLLVIDANGTRDSAETVIRVFPVATNQVRINRAIERGLRYLYTTQVATGYWYSTSSEYGHGATGMALLAFEENGHRPLNDHNDDIYAEYVKLGLDYLTGSSDILNLSTDAGGNPEEISTNASYDQYGYGLSGKGVLPRPFSGHATYANSCMVLAIVGSHTTAESAQEDTIKTEPMQHS